MIDTERTVFTVPEVAEILGLRNSSVRSAIRTGALEHIKTSSRVNLVSRTAIEAYQRDHLGKRGGYKPRKPKAESETE